MARGARRDTIHLAAGNGIGALSFSFVEPEDVRSGVILFAGRLSDPMRN